jgi:hypothetical protein
LNGNKYRAVLTSGLCAPATSNAALLTVNAIPGAPKVEVVNNCDGSSDLKASDYTGALLWSNGATTVTIHVNAGGNYTVTQTVNGCTSPSGSGNAAPNNTPPRPAVTITEPKLCGPSTATVTVTCPLSYTASDGTKIIYEYRNGTGAWTESTEFGNLTAGSGFSIQVRNKATGCESSVTDCKNYSGYSCTQPTSMAKAIVEAQILQPETKVTAAPNPFNDRVRFTLKPATSGKGTLDLYNIAGQKIKTVFQGDVKAGQVQNVEYRVTGVQRANLIYVFTLGNKKVTGQLINLK